MIEAQAVFAQYNSSWKDPQNMRFQEILVYFYKVIDGLKEENETLSGDSHPLPLGHHHREQGGAPPMAALSGGVWR